MQRQSPQRSNGLGSGRIGNKRNRRCPSEGIEAQPDRREASASCVDTFHCAPSAANVTRSSLRWLFGRTAAVSLLMSGWKSDLVMLSTRSNGFETFGEFAFGVSDLGNDL